MKRIREVQLAGLTVGHVIHRHGMDDETAFEVEAALIDAYPGLTNIAGGTGNSDFGAMHASEIIRRYAAEPAVFKHKALLISVNRSAAETSLYEATRYAWKISRSKAERADVILATLQGMIVGAFVADSRRRQMQLVAIQFFHTTLIVWLYGCLSYMVFAHLTSRWGVALGVSYASVALEGLAVVPLGFRCPLTEYVQLRYGPSVNDSFIPPNAAQWVMPVGVFLFAVSLLVVPLRWFYLKRSGQLGT